MAKYLCEIRESGDKEWYNIECYNNDFDTSKLTKNYFEIMEIASKLFYKYHTNYESDIDATKEIVANLIEAITRAQSNPDTRVYFHIKPKYQGTVQLRLIAI